MKKKALYFGTWIVASVLCLTNTFTLKAAPVRTFSEAQRELGVKETYKEGQALVLYKNNAVTSKKSAQDVLTMGNEIQVEKLWTFENPDQSKPSEMDSLSSSDGLSIGLVSSESMTTKQLIEKLKKEDSVETAEPNYRLHALSTSDTYYEKQWALDNIGQNGGVQGNSINISEKWKETTGSDEVVVAVVDTGIDYTHEDLRENIWENTYQPSLKGEHGFDFINGDGDPLDDNGHGTHCAGIIGAKGDNGIGVSGVNQNVKIMALKILDEEGYGYGSDEINAYHYINKALNLGVNIVAINNSWGGGEESEIFDKLINLVGEKGAVSVCAAGNESNNNDEGGDYPAGYESTYKIVVAASNENGELASFSNYGKQTVDIAAPGTDILSTVSYNCYNPSLYDEEKQKMISEKFNDFEGDVSEELAWNLMPDQEGVSFFNLDNTKDTEKYKAEITDEKYFGEKGGKSLKLSFGTLEEEECAGIRIPYSISAEEGKENPEFSMMIKTKGPESDGEDEGIFAIVDVPAGTKMDEDMEWVLILYNGLGVYVNGEEDNWTHFNVITAETEETPAQDRELWMFFIAEKKGEYSVYLDDIGMSSENADKSEFEKYDFYSGTSMAASFVTGALALESAADPNEITEEKIDNVLSYVRESDQLFEKNAAGGTLDFSQKVSIRPRIGDVSVNAEKGQIQIKGSGLDAENLEVKIVSNGQEKSANIVKKTKESVTIADDGWMNRIVTITVTGNGKTSTKKDVYLVKGKSGYTLVKDMEFSMSDIMTTDGSYIYSADSLFDTIDVIDTTDPEYMWADTVFSVNPEKYFKKDSESLGEYDFTFGKDLVYMDGKLYNVAAFSEVYEGGYDYDEEDYAGSTSYEDDYDDDESFGDILSGVAYSSQYKLLCFDPVSEKIRNLGELPEDVRQTEDWTLASYNGKLYLIGGYDYRQKEFSRKVKIYNPSTGKWTNGPSLPEGRAGGKAIQNGNRLIYTLGAGADQKGVEVKEQTCPCNLILQGNHWTISKKKINPYFTGKTVVYGENSYNIYNASVGLCAEGVIYSGTPTEGLGDTFIYNVNKDQFQATKYSQIKELSGETTFTGVAVGSTLYGFDQDGEAYKLKINSGLLSVAAKKVSHGKIVNANKKFMPGTAVRLTAQPSKGYVVKSFLVDGKKINGRTTVVRLSSNMNASVHFEKAVSKIKLNKTSISLKAGKTFKLKVKITPVNATSKKVTYHSSNKKYATVSSKGVIKAKKEGKGKKVVITVKATDGSGKKAKCTVKIK